MQPQIAGPFGQRPLGVVGNVVPLPDVGKFLAGEIVVALIRRGGRLTVASVGLDPGARRAREIAGQAKIRPAVRPGDGRKTRRAAERIIIHH